jgi:mRNA interferase HicA
LPISTGCIEEGDLCPLTNTTLLLLFWRRHELQTNEKMVGATGGHFYAGQGFSPQGVLNGRQSALPMHGTQELGKGLEAAIKRQLGLKKE